tara:strand:- start:1325 stop:1867 length:543 start_codon:yes stop_codon:yes gene_type:complete
MAEPILNPEANFTGPIPGASLTTEVGNRPWENPPKESDLDTIINIYLRRLSNFDIVQPLLQAIKNGTSITTIVESVIETAVMEGEHTIDTGILASPILVEYLKQSAEISKIDYKLSSDDVQKGDKTKKIDNMLLEEVLKEMEDEDSSLVSKDIETSAKEIKSSSKGLMARKMNKEDIDNG